MDKKSFLFFIVHPAKFHVFRHTINCLKNDGHLVDIVITSKDVLEQLILNEGWSYRNIFPNGRKIQGIPTYLAAFLNAIVTIVRLELFLLRRNYSLFITDDLLVVNGKLRGTPSILFQDDDVSAVPESVLLHKFATHIMTPSVSYMGKHADKTIEFYGYKELGSLHPSRFSPDKNIIKSFNPDLTKYFVLRLVSLKSTHDLGKQGLNNDEVQRLISMLETKGAVFITSERELPEQFEKYRIKISPNDMAHALYFAEFLIADSQTMSAEAGVLGTPFIRFNDFVGKISYLKELEEKYELGFGIRTDEKEKLFTAVEELLKNENLRYDWELKREKMIAEKVDLTSFMTWVFKNYPESAGILKNDSSYQSKFM